MTPEQLAHLRRWAEWGESPTPETTIALLDHVDTLTKRLGECHCDKGPTTDGPEEDCPQHGRPYSHWVNGVDTLAARLEAVRELHTSLKPDSGGEHYLDPLTRKPRCGECLLIYPCPTIQAIDSN